MYGRTRIRVLECDFPGVKGYRIGFARFAAIQDIAYDGAADRGELGAYLMEPSRAGVNFPQATIGLALQYSVRQHGFLC